MIAPRNKPLIYVSGPMSGDIENNCNRGIDEADKVYVLGAAIIVPHLWYWYDKRHPHPYDELIELDYEHIARCDALYCFASSRGADLEVAFAEKYEIPVLRKLDEVLAFIARWHDAQRIRSASSGA